MARKPTAAVSKYERWIHNKWRPFIAWQYFVVNIFDFIIGPYIYSIGTAVIFGYDKVEAWQPLTLQGGGVYHIAMLTIIGATTWQRSKEKIEMMRTQVEQPEPDLKNDVPFPDTLDDDLTEKNKGNQ